MGVFKKRARQTTSPVPLPIRKHKGLVFRPIYASPRKRDVNHFLKKTRGGEQIAHNRYYRVYKHRYQGYVVYMSDKKKLRYGGVRRRSPTGMGRYSKR